MSCQHFIKTSLEKSRSTRYNIIKIQQKSKRGFLRGPKGVPRGVQKGSKTDQTRLQTGGGAQESIVLGGGSQHLQLGHKNHS